MALLLLAHVGYRALTSLPLGAVPGPPAGVAERRRNHDLRVQVVSFLNEVQRVEKFRQKAAAAGYPLDEVEKNLRGAHERIRSTADEVVRTVGRIGF